jgi:glycosyltransferase involved in cell wall biosynthesis
MPKIHLWCPSVRPSQGGIESYSFSLASALREAIDERDLAVFVRNDSAGELRETLRSGLTAATSAWLPKRLWTMGFAWMVVTRALREKPDLIITTHLNFGPFAALVRRLTRIPYWIVLHGYESWEIQRPSQERAVCEADLLLPVSEFTRKRVMENYGVPAERMHLVHDTFDPERFTIGPKPTHLLKRFELLGEGKIILTVGRLSAAERYKGHDRLIRALPVIRARVPNTKYLIVGGGDDRSRLEAIAAEHNVADAVIFAGRVPQEALPDYYRLCDLYAMPSTGEGFGIVFLEALAAGKPVLGGNRDGAVDALNGGELGVLVDPHDERAIAEEATAMLLQTHPHPLLNQPEQLRASVIERFGPERFKQALAQLLSDKAG